MLVLLFHLFLYLRAVVFASCLVVIQQWHGVRCIRCIISELFSLKTQTLFKHLNSMSSSSLTLLSKTQSLKLKAESSKIGCQILLLWTVSPKIPFLAVIKWWSLALCLKCFSEFPDGHISWHVCFTALGGCSYIDFVLLSPCGFSMHWKKGCCVLWKGFCTGLYC